MSERCFEFFVNEACFYECDVNVAKYRKHETCNPNGWQMANMPIKASFCDDWYDACAEDFYCSCIEEDNCSNALSYFSVKGVNCTLESGRCKTFAETFKDGKELCEQMWDNSFMYEEDEKNAYTMEFKEGEPNPNNDINLHIALPDPCPEKAYPLRDELCGAEAEKHPDIVPHTCHLCQVRNTYADETLEGTKEASTYGGDDLGPCKAYEAYSCCSPDLANAIGSERLYGADYRWDRCYQDGKNEGPNSKCARWFTAEECLYECDVNVGKFRQFEDCMDGEDTNAWKIQNMPLKASECDAWFDDCQNELICTCVDEEDCAQYDNTPAPGSIFAGLPECNGDTCRRFKDVYKNGREMCEKMYEGSFKYETHEQMAYSLNLKAESGHNRNYMINTHLPFNEKCPDFKAEWEEVCQGELTGEQILEALGEAADRSVQPAEIAKVAKENRSTSENGGSMTAPAAALLAVAGHVWLQG